MKPRQVVHGEKVRGGKFESGTGRCAGSPPNLTVKRVYVGVSNPVGENWVSPRRMTL